MSQHGVVPEGFLKKLLAEILTEIQTSERGLLGQNLNTLATSPLGQINGIHGDKIRELWDLAEAVYKSAYPDSAEGEALEAICALSGITRLAASNSLVTCDRLLLEAGTTLTAGSMAKVGPSGQLFELLADVENATSYDGMFTGYFQAVEEGSVAGYAGTIDTIHTVVSGWLANPVICGREDGPVAGLNGLTLKLEVDGGAIQTVTFSAGGSLTITQICSQINAQTTGLTAFEAATTSNPVVGIKSDTDVSVTSSIRVTENGTANLLLGFGIAQGLPTTEAEERTYGYLWGAFEIVKGFNYTDADIGRIEETDPDLRFRRAALLRAPGNATVGSILTHVAAVRDVDECIVLENDTMYTDIQGLPAKSFAVITSGTAAAQDIGNAIWLSKPAGIQSYGSEAAVVVVDTLGKNHNVYFSKAAEKWIYITCAIQYNEDYPADGNQQVQQALSNFGDLLTISQDVIYNRFKAVPYVVPGVLDIGNFYVSDHSTPDGIINIPIGFFEIAKFDTSRIVVTSTKYVEP